MKKQVPLYQPFPEMPQIQGVRFATAHSGIRYKRDDLLLMHFPNGADVAGVFTKSLAASSPVLACRHHLSLLHKTKGKAIGLIVNAGNANVFTGMQGHMAVQKKVDQLSKLWDCRNEQIFVASTGVIGQFLPVEKITACLDGLNDRLSEDANWEHACSATMTTDTFTKGSHASFELDGATVTINGFAKGSGMIEPNMATMLAWIFTDANIDSVILQRMIEQACAKSFNAITVDSDTSTSDTLMAFATAAAGNTRITESNQASYQSFYMHLEKLMIDLAKQVVCDGEGATKLIEVNVHHAAQQSDANIIAKTIANSPLVKTAIAGEDANWGRIVMAVGKSGVAVDMEKVAIAFGGHVVAKDGMAIQGYDETPVAEHLKGKYIAIDVDLFQGSHHATVWTCDLTEEYIKINANYRS